MVCMVVLAQAPVCSGWELSACRYYGMGLWQLGGGTKTGKNVGLKF